MKTENCCGDCSKYSALLVGVVGSFLVVAGLVYAMRKFTAPPPPSADRVAERLKNLAEVRAAGADGLNNYGTIDPVRKIYRLPMAEAEALFLKEWGNEPAAGRATLMSRVDKATAALPKPPEKKNEFE